MIIVLVTSGKHESVDTVKVKLFVERFQAEDYCKQVSTGKAKYWVHGEIVDEGYVTDLSAPDWTVQNYFNP